MTIADSAECPDAADTHRRAEGVHSPAAGYRILNVFALPAESEVRSFLLVTAALMLACVCAVQLASLLTGRLRPAPLERLLAETERILDANGPIPEEFPLLVAREMFLLTLFTAVKLAVVVVALGLWCLLACRLYRGHPRRVRCRWQLIPFDAARDQRLLDFVARVHASIPTTGATQGPPRCPRVEVEAGAMARRVAQARAFGLDHEPVIALTNATRLEMRRDPALFAARILHELAHFAHGDVRADQVVRAVWRATLVTGVFPMLGCLLLVFARLPRRSAPSRACPRRPWLPRY